MDRALVGPVCGSRENLHRSAQRRFSGRKVAGDCKEFRRLPGIAKVAAQRLDCLFVTVQVA